MWPSACDTSWTDPTSFVISSLNTMAFVLLMSAAMFDYQHKCHSTASYVVHAGDASRQYLEATHTSSPGLSSVLVNHANFTIVVELGRRA